jgi:hypothetical protein
MGLGDMLKGAVSQVKDSGAAAAIRAWLSREMADYGEVLDFKLDSRARSAHLHVLLKGERDPLAVTIEGYEFGGAGGQEYVIVQRAHASRPWVNAVLKNFVLGRRHSIPSQYSGVAKMVLAG